MAEIDDAWIAHARKVPLINRTDPSHLPETVEDLEMAIEYLAEKAGIRVRDLWPIVQKRRVERKDAEYRAIFAADAAEKLRIAENKAWLQSFNNDELFKDAIVIVESGGVFPVNEFRCNLCRTKLLDGDAGRNYVQAKFQYRQFSLTTKNELLRVVRSEILDARYSTYVRCPNPKCRNDSANFKMTVATK